MTDPSDLSATSYEGQEELELSIRDLQAYRQRLVQEVTSMGQKLKLPQARVDRDLRDHLEIKGLDQLLNQLLQQRGNIALPSDRPADPHP